MIDTIYPANTSTYLRLLADQLDTEKEKQRSNSIFNFFIVIVDKDGMIFSANRYVGKHSAMELLGAVERTKIDMVAEILATET